MYFKLVKFFGQISKFHLKRSKSLKLRLIKFLSAGLSAALAPPAVRCQNCSSDLRKYKHV